MRIRRHFAGGSVARDTLWSLTVEATNLVVTLVSFTLLGKRLGPAGYGQYVAMYSILGALSAFPLSGVSLIVLQHAIREKEDLGSVVSSCVSIALVSGLITGTIAVVLAHAFISNLALTTIVLFACAELALNPLAELTMVSAQVGKGFSAAAQLRIARLLMRITLLLSLSLSGPLTIVRISYVYPVLMVGLVTVLMRTQGRRLGISYRLGKPLSRHFKGSTLWAVMITSQGVQNDSDKVVLTSYHFDRDAGLYSAAYRLVQLGLVPIQALIASSHQRFLEHDADSIGQHRRRSLRFTAVALSYAIVATGILLLIAPLLTFLVGKAFKDSIKIVPWIAPLLVLRSMSLFPLNGLLGLGRLGLRTIILTTSAVVSLASYIILVPRMSWKGAAWGTIISESFLVVVSWSALTYCQRQHDRQVRAKPKASLENWLESGRARGG